MTTIPTPSELYTELVEAIVKAVPDVLNALSPFSQAMEVALLNGIQVHIRPITLEDVLRTIKANVGLYQTTTHAMSPLQMLLGTVDYRCVTEWHLGHSLEWHKNNAHETISYLHSLLCPKK